MIVYMDPCRFKLQNYLTVHMLTEPELHTRTKKRKDIQFPTPYLTSEGTHLKKMPHLASCSIGPADLMRCAGAYSPEGGWHALPGVDQQADSLHSSGASLHFLMCKKSFLASL